MSLGDVITLIALHRAGDWVTGAAVCGERCDIADSSPDRIAASFGDLVNAGLGRAQTEPGAARTAVSVAHHGGRSDRPRRPRPRGRWPRSVRGTATARLSSRHSRSEISHAHRPLDPMPGSMLVRFQSDLQHGFAFEIDGTGIEEGLRPTIEPINRGAAALDTISRISAN